MCQDLGMVWEVATIDVKAGSEDQFVAAFNTGLELLAGTPGCRSVRLIRGIENPTRFTLLNEWDTLSAHEDNFRGTDRFPRWLEYVGPYFDGTPTVEHYAAVD